MDIRIGIQNTPRELAFETDVAASEVEALVSAALTGQSPTLRLVDVKGSVYLVPASTIAYIEVGGESQRRVGFVA